MASRTVGTHLDAETIDRLRAIAATENRAPSQIIGIALKLFLDQSPGARRALLAIDGIVDAAGRDYASKLIGRAAMKAYEAILDDRQTADYHPSENQPLDSEESIEAEAVRMCRR